MLINYSTPSCIPTLVQCSASILHKQSYAYHLLSTTKLIFVAVSLVYICLYVPYTGMVLNIDKELVAETFFVKQVISQIGIGIGLMFLEAKTRGG